MEGSFPFFYYDILTRIVPGASMLAVLWNIDGFGPIDWLHGFIDDTSPESWEKLLIPVLLAGIAYVIGVIFEVVDFSPGIEKFQGMKWVSELIDASAFKSALVNFGKDGEMKKLAESMSKKGAESKTKEDAKSKRKEDVKTLKDYRDELWQNLILNAGSDDKKASQAFVHCHRFQAEQKMFLHLVYPTIIFEFVSGRNWFLDWQGPIGLIALCSFSFCCYSRSKRRWIQVVQFSKFADE